VKIGFIISVYEKVDDLMAHLDIFKYCPFQHEIIITYMKSDIPERHLQEIQKYHSVSVNGLHFRFGPLLSFIQGIRKAKELGLDYVCYKNADDWLFNWDFEKKNFSKMMYKDHSSCGYNWFSLNVHTNFAMNQLYADVNKFFEFVDEVEHEFIRSPLKVLCEFKIGDWILKSIGSWYNFYRLPGRERFPGVGHSKTAVEYIYREILKSPIPPNIFDGYEDNNRFFNRKWQLIGSHSNNQRLILWNQIKEEVEYHKELEKEDNFKRWIEAAQERKIWNLKKEISVAKRGRLVSNKVYRPKVPVNKIPAKTSEFKDC